LYIQPPYSELLICFVHPPRLQRLARGQPCLLRGCYTRPPPGEYGILEASVAVRGDQAAEAILTRDASRPWIMSSVGRGYAPMRWTRDQPFVR